MLATYSRALRPFSYEAESLTPAVLLTTSFFWFLQWMAVLGADNRLRGPDWARPLCSNSSLLHGVALRYLPQTNYGFSFWVMQPRDTEFWRSTLGIFSSDHGNGTIIQFRIDYSSGDRPLQESVLVPWINELNWCWSCTLASRVTIFPPSSEA